MTNAVDVFNELQELAEEHPNQRAGQLIVNAFGCCEHRAGRCIFYASDGELMGDLKDFPFVVDKERRERIIENAVVLSKVDSGPVNPLRENQQEEADEDD